MTGVAIRDAVVGDAEALTAVISAAYSVYGGRIDDLPDVAAGLGDEIKLHSVYAAFDGSAPVGVAVLVCGDDAHLANIAVHPTAGGKGVGKRLLAHVEQVARARGYGELHLATHTRIPENVVLYTRLGWHETGRSGNKVTMVKPL